MYINGKLILFKNIYANNSYCINFGNLDEMEDIFLKGENKYINDNILVIDYEKLIQDGDTIVLPLPYETTIKYNCAIWKNEDDNLTPSHIMFAKISNYNYCGCDCTKVTLTLDALQTYLCDIKNINGLVDRAHAPRRIKAIQKSDAYVINPDLFFIEDNDSNRMVATESERILQDEVFTTLVFSLAKPTYNITTVLEDGNYNNEGLLIGFKQKYFNSLIYGGVTKNIQQGETFYVYDSSHGIRDNEDGSQRRRGFLLYLEGKEDDETYKYIGFNKALSNYGEDTDLYAITIKKSNVDSFFARFKSLKDKLVNIFMHTLKPLDICYRNAKPYKAYENRLPNGNLKYKIPILNFTTGEYGLNQMAMGSSKPSELFTDFSNEIRNQLYEIYDISLLSERLLDIAEYGPMAYFNLANNTNIDNDIRSVSNETKLSLYPYMYYTLKTLSSSVARKYQEVYDGIIDNRDKIYLASRNLFGAIESIDPLNSSPQSKLSFLYSNGTIGNTVSPYYNTSIFTKTTTAKTDAIATFQALNIIDIYENEKSNLPQNVIYLPKYEQYLNYNKAMVDSQFKQSSIEGFVNSFSSLLGGVGDILDGNIGGAFNSVVSGEMSLLGVNHNLEQLQLNEQSLMKQPQSSVTGNNSGQDSYFTSLNKLEIQGETQTGVTIRQRPYRYVFEKMELYPYMKNILEEKFYHFGYHIPVNISWDYILFEIWRTSREYFTYIKFNGVEINGDIPFIYQNEIVNRLNTGVKFMQLKENGYPNIFNNLNNKDSFIYSGAFFTDADKEGEH